MVQLYRIVGWRQKCCRAVLADKVLAHFPLQFTVDRTQKLDSPPVTDTDGYTVLIKDAIGRFGRDALAGGENTGQVQRIGSANRHQFLLAAQESAEAVVAKVERTVRELKICMFCVGARSVGELRRVPLLSGRDGGVLR